MDSERWQAIAHLYESALGRQPDERAAFLAQAAGADDALRREVESLLEHDGTPLFIDEPMLATAAAVLDDDRSELKAGVLLGPYRIDALLGIGGMGQVYRATDTRLSRVVALKILPRELARNAEFRARFEREAHTIAALSHPHICTLYDIGRCAEVDFLVMECLEGETLAARIEKGPIPFDQALSLADQIADALIAAHGRGIIHRDLKPSNIILSRSGVKLLDFGLAKSAVSTVAFGGAVTAEERAPGLTAQGRILGTVQYMAPEQLEGKPADARTDLFASGAVVYEMLTGRKAFEGKSQASLIGAIMHAEPRAIGTDQPLTPPALERAIRTCLEKNPDDRWQTARDLRRELLWIRQDLSSSALTRRTFGRAGWLVASVLALGLAISSVDLLTRPEPTAHIARFTIDAPAGTSLPAPGQAYSPTISPDGTMLVFQVVRKGEPLLAVRTIDALEARIVPGSERGRWPFWSPDSRMVAFFADGKLKKTPVSGGAVQTICDAPTGMGGDWNRKGVIVFLGGEAAGFYQVPAAGGEPTAVISSPNGRRFRSRPYFLPDGRRFLYAASPDMVYLGSIDGEPSREVLKGTPMALYAPPGYLLFYQGDTLVAQRFNSDLSASVGDPVPIGKGTPGPIFGGGGLAYSVSTTGVLAYKTDPTADLPNTVGWFDRTGNRERIGPFPFETFAGVALSPDGTQLAMQSPRGLGPQSEIWLYHLIRRQPTQLTFTDGSDRAPVWSPDGQRVAFASQRPQASGLYIKTVAGERPEELLLRSDTVDWEEHWPTDWSSHGIVFARGQVRDEQDVWILPVDAPARTPYQVTREPGIEGEAKISPDGKWLAYVQRDRLASPFRVFVRSLTTPGVKWLVSSTAGGRRPYWRRDGTELFYVEPGGSLMSVSIDYAATGLRVGTQRMVLQDLGATWGAGRRFFGISPDGKRFLLPVTDDWPRTADIVVVTNWPALAKRH